MAVTPSEFKAVMGSFAASVTVVTTLDPAGRRHGLTATAFASLSLDPPLCLVCLDNRAATLAALRASRVVAVNILDESQQELSARFASRSEDKFAGVAAHAGAATGCPLLDGALAHIECRVVELHAGGDHVIVVGELVSAHVATGDTRPLLYFRGRYADLAARG